MDKVKRNAIAFLALMEYEYFFVVAHKGKTKKIYLKFAKEDFHHLEGIGQLNDLAYHSMPAEKTFQMAVDGEITEEKLKKSQKYFTKSINNKVDYLYLLEKFLDNNEIIFNFAKDKTGKTKIDAKMFLYTDMDGNDVYLFIDSAVRNGEVYFGRSFVAKSNYNYRVGKRKLTVLWKEMAGMNTRICTKEKKAELDVFPVIGEFIQKNNPYEKKPSLKFDLRAYESYVRENNLGVDEITPEIMKKFIED